MSTISVFCFFLFVPPPNLWFFPCICGQPSIFFLTGRISYLFLTIHCYFWTFLKSLFLWKSPLLLIDEHALLYFISHQIKIFYQFDLKFSSEHIFLKKCPHNIQSEESWQKMVSFSEFIYEYHFFILISNLESKVKKNSVGLFFCLIGLIRKGNPWTWYALTSDVKNAVNFSSLVENANNNGNKLLKMIHSWYLISAMFSQNSAHEKRAKMKWNKKQILNQNENHKVSIITRKFERCLVFICSYIYFAT